jgi:hypothetical protein
VYRKDTQALEAVPPGSDESRARFMALYERCYGSILRYAWRRVIGYMVFLRSSFTQRLEPPK